MPKCIQNIIYRRYKKKLIKVIKRINNPIYTYPFLVWIELSLDDIYEDLGLKAVKKRVLEWSENHCNSVAHHICSPKL
jgi:hypothetical protein